jgi:hypothetical protein
MNEQKQIMNNERANGGTEVGSSSHERESSVHDQQGWNIRYELKKIKSTKVIVCRSW